MIDHMYGRITHMFLQEMMYMEIHSITYEIHVSSSTYERYRIDDPAGLFIHLHVREESMTLYGFYDAVQRALFKRLLRCKGVGPGIALKVSGLKEITKDALTKVPGVGTILSSKILDHLEGK